MHVYKPDPNENPQEGYQSQAEKDLAILEEEFHYALENPHSFHIFNRKV